MASVTPVSDPPMPPWEILEFYNHFSLLNCAVSSYAPQQIRELRCKCEGSCFGRSFVIQKWQDVSEWMKICRCKIWTLGSVMEKYSAVMEKYSAVVEKIQDLLNQLLLLKQEPPHSASRRQKGRSKVQVQQTQNQTTCQALVVLALLNKSFTHLCCACSGFTTGYKETLADINEFFAVFLSAHSTEQEQRDLPVLLSTLLLDNYMRRPMLEQNILQPFWKCLVETPVFLNLASQDALKKRIVYASEEEENWGPWDCTRSYMLSDNANGILAVLYPHPSAQSAPTQCALTGVSLWSGCPQIINTYTQEKLSCPSLPAKFLETLDTSAGGVCLAGVYSKDGQSYVVPLSQGKKLQGSEKEVRLPCGDGLCLLWIPQENYERFAADFPNPKGGPSSPLYKWMMLHSVSKRCMADNTPFWQAIKMFDHTDYPDTIQDIRTMVLKCLEAMPFNEEEEAQQDKGPHFASYFTNTIAAHGGEYISNIYTALEVLRNRTKQIEQAKLSEEEHDQLVSELILKIDAMFKAFKEPPNSMSLEKQAFQQALDQYNALKKQYKEHTMSKREFLCGLLEFIKKLSDSDVDYNATTAGEGVWVFYPVRSFQLLDNQTVEITTLRSVKKGSAEAEDEEFRVISHPKTCDRAWLYDSLVLRQQLRKWERVIQQSLTSFDLTMVGEEVCMYVPCQVLDECWRQKLSKLEKKIQTQVLELELIESRSHEEQTTLDALRDLLKQGEELPPQDPPESQVGWDEVGGTPLHEKKETRPSLPKKSQKKRKSRKGGFTHCGQVGVKGGSPPPPENEQEAPVLEGAIGFSYDVNRADTTEYDATNEADNTTDRNVSENLAQVGAIQERGAVGGTPLLGKKETRRPSSSKKSQPKQQDLRPTRETSPPDNFRELLRQHPEVEVTRSTTSGTHIRLTAPGKGNFVLVSDSSKKERRKARHRSAYYLHLARQWMEAQPQTASPKGGGKKRSKKEA